MRRFAFLLLLFTLAAGCIVEDRPVGTGGTGGTGGAGGTGGDGGPCGTCEDPTPVCNLLNNQCVACTEGQVEYCTAQGLLCDVGSFMCVGCSGDSDCTDPNAARCDNNVCVECTESGQCEGIEGIGEAQNACADGVCVDCTPATETNTCPDPRTCDPATNKCTNVFVGSLNVCEECVSDSQCGEDNAASDAHHCVPMFYEMPDNRFPNSDTGFCLKTTEGGCLRPYSVTLFDLPSLSDPSAQDDYCGVDEDRVTCPAVRALLSDTQCTDGTDEECPTGGICRDVGSLQDRCTYFCGLPAQCPGDPPADTCGSSGSGGDDYCGG